MTQLYLKQLYLKQQAQKFLIAFLISLLFLISLYGLCFHLAIDTDLKSNFWLREVMEVQQFIEKKSRKEKKRIIIISGSNALFGINSKSIEDFTGIKTINFSSHAAWPFSYMVNQVDEIAKEGDIIVLPLETDIYTRNEDEDLSRWLMRNVLRWNQEYYFNLPWSEKLKFISKVPVGLVFKNIKNRFVTKKRNKILGQFKTSESIIRDIENIWTGKIILSEKDKSNAYSYRSLNQWGDMSWNFKMNKVNFINDRYKSFSMEISDNYIKQYRRLTQLALKRHLQLIFTWPVALKSPLFNLDRAEDREKVHQFEKRLSSLGIELKGELNQVYYSRDFFFDTSKHLNREGVKLRSQVLEKVIMDNYNLPHKLDQ